MPLPRRNDPSATFRNLDWPTIAIYLIMVLAGVVSIYAANYNFDNASMFSFSEFSGKQLCWIGLSILIALVIVLIDTRMYETYAYPLYILIVLLLFITPFVANDIKGSRSWISFGSMSLQPAEFAKFATALALAKLFSSYHFSLNAKASNYVRALTIIFLPIILILLQNETGSALTFMALFFVLYREGMSGLVLFAALFAVVIFVVAIKYTDILFLGIPTGQFIVFLLIMVITVAMAIIYSKRTEVGRNLFILYAGAWLIEYLLTIAGVTVPGVAVNIAVIAIGCIYLITCALRYRRPGLFIPVATAVLSTIFLFSVDFAFDKLQHHQKQRIEVALGKIEDLRDAGYNVNQSKIAIGSGGFFGRGFLKGTQTKLKYVPEQHTDFIFCTIGEERGFIGAAGVTLLFLALILRIIKIGERQPTTFGRVYAYCVASYFIFHFCINIGMVIGLCPVIGIPLPFFSYGGSSLWGFTILLFILLKIDATRKNVMAY